MLGGDGVADVTTQQNSIRAKNNGLLAGEIA